ncbi:MAG: O-antigen ligase family protein [Candidatus Humimicrobiaceae bacterium]
MQAHNSYLQFIAETSVIGLGLLLFFWISCFVIIFKAFKRASSVFEEKIYLSSLASIVALSFLSFTENYFSATTIMICISLVISLSIGAAWEKREENKFEIADTSK